MHYRRWLAQQDVVTRLESAAGERMLVDFAGDTVPVTDPDTGEVWQAQVFVSVLGASGYLYAEATRSQDLASCSWPCECRLSGIPGRAHFFDGAHIDHVMGDRRPPCPRHP